ncbi:hypothetical protein VN97_g12707 [Penicillium thymicola]|uniref:Uncharacterized protein n=1 Tax=Penicillium thymicola TaxID=293382 RepID=A0AAI9T5R2_PENTH|nr:hypothetical protein VN97_g12707 [Penicillium thymicola]
MAQSCSEQAPEVVLLAIDIGTTYAKVFLSENPDSPDPVDYALEFRLSSDDRKKTTTELDTTLVFSENGQVWMFGPNGLSFSGAHVFTEWKLGAMGLEPYAQMLAKACERLQESAPQLESVSAATPFRKLFSHIRDTAKQHLQQKYGGSFDAIKCYLTYPVSCSESLRLLLRQEASCVGLDVIGGVSEPWAAAHYIKSKTRLELPPGAKLIIDFGGATVV